MYNEKQYRRISDDCEKRWKNAVQNHDACGAFDAINDYKKNIRDQESELEKMNPNSKEYSRAEQFLDEQRGTCSTLEMQQPREFNENEELKRTYEKYNFRNRVISGQMKDAIDRGDTARYDSLRDQYQRNISSQQDVASVMNRFGVDYRDTVEEEKFDIQNHDISMRDRIDEENEMRAKKGKPVTPENQERAAKYARQVNADTEDLLNYQNDRKIETMRQRGASESEIQAQEKDGQYEINKFRRSCSR